MIMEDLATFLSGSGLGFNGGNPFLTASNSAQLGNVFGGRMPDAEGPVECVVFYEGSGPVAGVLGGNAVPYETPTITVAVRSTTYSKARNAIEKVRNFFDSMNVVVLGGVRYMNFELNSTPIQWPPNDHDQITLSYTMNVFKTISIPV